VEACLLAIYLFGQTGHIVCSSLRALCMNACWTVGGVFWCPCLAFFVSSFALRLY